jgi:hypothetical protein
MCFWETVYKLFRNKNNLKAMLFSKVENASGGVGKWINGNGRNQS